MGRSIDSLWVVVRITNTTSQPDRIWLSDASDHLIMGLPDGVEARIIGHGISRHPQLSDQNVDDMIMDAIGPDGVTGLAQAGIECYRTLTNTSDKEKLPEVR